MSTNDYRRIILSVLAPHVQPGRFSMCEDFVKNLAIGDLQSLFKCFDTTIALKASEKYAAAWQQYGIKLSQHPFDELLEVTTDAPYMQIPKIDNPVWCDKVLVTLLVKFLTSANLLSSNYLVRSFVAKQRHLHGTRALLHMCVNVGFFTHEEFTTMYLDSVTKQEKLEHGAVVLLNKGTLVLWNHGKKEGAVEKQKFKPNQKAISNNVLVHGYLSLHKRGQPTSYIQAPLMLKPGEYVWSLYNARHFAWPVEGGYSQITDLLKALAGIGLFDSVGNIVLTYVLETNPGMPSLKIFKRMQRMADVVRTNETDYKKFTHPKRIKRAAKVQEVNEATHRVKKSKKNCLLSSVAPPHTAASHPMASHPMAPPPPPVAPSPVASHPAAPA